MIVGDNFLRSVYSVYDYGDFDKSGKMGNPYIKFLSLVDPNKASAEFASARGSVPRNNITYHAVNSTATVSGSNTASLSDEIAKNLNKITTYFPIMLAVLGLNVLVILLLAIAAFIYIFRRRRTSSARIERKARRLTPYPLRVVSTDSFVPPPELEPSQPSQPRSLSHAYQPVSMALSEETFVPPSPAFHGGSPSGRSLDYRPKSVA
jgi:saccharopepsin